MERQLKSLKHERAGGSPDAHWLASTRNTLMMQIGNTVGENAGKTRLGAAVRNLNIFFPKNFGALMAVPLVMALLILGAGASSSAIVAAAHDTLPGDPFYTVKLAAESVSLMAASESARPELRIEIAGRRLDEMARLSASADPEKETKIARAAALFSNEMSSVRRDLAALQSGRNPDAAVRIAMQVESRTDRYQALFQHGLLTDRPTLRMALLSLDEVSVKALEILVDRQGLASNTLPEAQLTSAVGQRIDSFAAHVAAAEDNLGGKGAGSPGSILTDRARAAVAEAKQLLSQGDFRAAVRKVSESADLVSQAQGAERKAAPASATNTPTTGSASATPSDSASSSH